MKDTITQASTECQKNLEKKNYEIVNMSKYGDTVFEAGEKQFSYVTVKECGTFLVDYKEQTIEHYLYEGEQPEQKKVEEILTEVKAMAKKIKLLQMF